MLSSPAWAADAGADHEPLVVPRAQVDSYYGRPIIKQPVWGSPQIPGYIFLGGLAGASSVLAGVADLTGNRDNQPSSAKRLR